ncbi:NAD-specific glutamate dehydrogenase [compost metagenome]
MQCQLVGAQVNTILFLKFPDDPIEDFLVEVFATQEAVTAGRQHLENTIVEFENRDVKSASAKIVNNNLLVFMLAEPVG